MVTTIKIVRQKIEKFNIRSRHKYSDLSFYPLEVDKRRAKRKKNIVKPCPECGKPLKAKSEKQWVYVLLAHKTLSKKHRSEEEKK
jgi:hypothetical protein